MIYDGLRVVDLLTALAGAYCAKLLDRSRCRRRGRGPTAATPGGRRARRGALRYLRTSQRSSPIAPWLDAGRRRRRRATWSATARRAAGRARRGAISALGHGGPDDGLDLPEPVLQARSGACRDTATWARRR